MLGGTLKGHTLLEHTVGLKRCTESCRKASVGVGCSGCTTVCRNLRQSRKRIVFTSRCVTLRFGNRLLDKWSQHTKATENVDHSFSIQADLFIESQKHTMVGVGRVLKDLFNSNAPRHSSH